MEVEAEKMPAIHKPKAVQQIGFARREEELPSEAEVGADGHRGGGRRRQHSVIPSGSPEIGDGMVAESREEKGGLRSEGGLLETEEAEIPEGLEFHEELAIGPDLPPFVDVPAEHPEAKGEGGFRGSSTCAEEGSGVGMDHGGYLRRVMVSL
jgi:hypothetical protein